MDVNLLCSASQRRGKSGLYAVRLKLMPCCIVSYSSIKLKNREVYEWLLLGHALQGATSPTTSYSLNPTYVPLRYLPGL